jgi:hypothetical protein
LIHDVSKRKCLGIRQRQVLWLDAILTTNLQQTESPDGTLIQASEAPCVIHSMIRGSIGFGIVSLAAFSVWAFGGKWLQKHLGESGLYGACALVFLALSGLLLHPLVRGSASLRRFYAIFIPSFLGYAIVWCVAWFALRFGPGEWLGSLLGTAALVGVLSWRFQNGSRFVQTSLIVFVLHSAGYFLGGLLTHWLLAATGSALLSGLSKPGILVVAKLAWGVLYGLGFGAGIGYAFHTAQNKNTP